MLFSQKMETIKEKLIGMTYTLYSQDHIISFEDFFDKIVNDEDFADEYDKLWEKAKEQLKK